MLRRRDPRREGPRRVGDLFIDPSRREVRVGDRPVKLANKEFSLLRALAAEPTRVFTKEELLRDVWGFRSMGRTRTLDSHASRLRRKLDPEDGPLRDQRLGRRATGSSTAERRDGEERMRALAELGIAGWPLGLTLAAVAVGDRLREARRRAALNRALHELRRPLQALVLGAGGIAQGPGRRPRRELALAALDDLDREINGRARRLARRPVACRALGRVRGRALARSCRGRPAARWSCAGGPGRRW